MEGRWGSTLWTTTAKFERATSEEIERHAPLLRRLLNLGYYGDDLTFEEKWSIGLFGIALAVERYDPSRGASYAYWIAYQIDKALKNEARRATTRRRHCALFNDAEGFDPIDEREWDEAAARDEREETERDLDALREALDALDPKERRLIQRLVFEDRTQEEVAREERKTQSWVSKNYRSTLKKIGRYIERKRGARPVCS